MDKDNYDNKKKTKDSYGFVDTGPPPDMKRRTLVFDSLARILNNEPSRSQRGGASHNNESRGSHVFTWGAGYHGQLGRKFQRGVKKYSPIPLLVELPTVVRQVTCGGLHTAVCTEAGTVYTWGDGRHGQLGHSPESFTLQPTPLLLHELSHVFVIQVAAGRHHTLALTDKHTIYSWGSSRYGQTGHGDRQMCKVPRRIDSTGHDFTFIESGDKHSFALTRSGEAYSWGNNEHGQIGHGKELSDVLKPTRIEKFIENNVEISHVSCGTIHSALLDTYGRVYICGFGEHFFPDDQAIHFAYEPIEIQFDKYVKQLACGQSHVIALTDDGNVYSWGACEYGQLGHGGMSNVTTPRLILKDKNIAQVSAGRYHSVAVTNAGIMFTWGCGENGQLGQGNDDNIPLPKVVESVIGTIIGHVSCGEHHTAAVSSAPWSKISGDVLEWLRAAREEYVIKERYLKETHRGLTNKDLKLIEEEMSRWYLQNESQKRAQREQEAKETEYTLKSIQEIDLDGSVLKHVGRLHLENVDVSRQSTTDSQALVPISPTSMGQPIKRQQTKRTNLLSILPSVSNNTSNKRISSPTQYPSGSQTARYTSSRQNGSRARSRLSEKGGELALLPPPATARTSFLRETANTLQTLTKLMNQHGELDFTQQLKHLKRLSFNLRKEHDTLKAKTNRLQKTLSELDRERKLIENSANQLNSKKEKMDKKLQDLQMQLDTVTIKITETAENRRNYELNIAHLKEEEFEHFNELESLRRQCAENKVMYKKMKEMQLHAFEEKEKAEAELQQFANEIKAYQNFIRKQMGNFSSLVTVNQKRKKRQHHYAVNKKSKQRERLNNRVENLQLQVREKDEEQASLNSEMEGLEIKLKHYEARFNEIASATGLTDTKGIIDKYFLKTEIREQLENEIEEKENKLQQLKRKHGKLQNSLSDAESRIRTQNWRDVDTMEEEYRLEVSKTKKTRSDVEATTQQLAFYQEGIVNLYRMLALANGKPVNASLENGEVWNAQTCQQLFKSIEEMVMQVRDTVKRQEEADERRERLKEEARVAEESNVVKEIKEGRVSLVELARRQLQLEEEEAANKDKELPSTINEENSI